MIENMLFVNLRFFSQVLIKKGFEKRRLKRGGERGKREKRKKFYSNVRHFYNQGGMGFWGIPK